MSSFAKKMFLAAIAVAALTSMAAAQVNVAEFDLQPNPSFLACLAAPGGPTPTAHVIVKRGVVNDTLTIEGNNLKPGLAFDMFTVENSPFTASGVHDPNFGNFGMAWYQSDLKANDQGHFKTTIKTVLLDELFGFNPNAGLNPINTFHVGFWFDNPNDANVNGCSFDVTRPTPFNAEHHAGPVAMISLPRFTGLGPLCANPNFNSHPTSCKP